MLAPLLAIIAVAIKLESPGPMLFKQKRHGKDCQTFMIYKFRSMTVTEDGENCTQAVKGDARTTLIGRWLRRLSLDELPQLFNVMAGDMSIVGPRPHPVALDERFGASIEGYYDRYRAKPGITGLAQIEGSRGPTEAPGSMERRVAFDLMYIENWTIRNDLLIIASTPYKALTSTNAF